ncbi:uncharacterized protein LOC119685955 [Teleopsis dalmanni]|uniref:uncharacterized protein LOC119673812 n=1 Tax=Teleopsis dalmanni TaxID=139649 RepID=UPI0018CFB878|nr:uncharacterized protein LOC119673812 [Teleopsis dalmanni]XP_037956303.1 uncharacterized protein LOC119685955 [Teleopsis dalmanni]
MAATKYCVLVAILGFAAVGNAATAVKATNMQSMINEETLKCESGEDSMACIKVRAMRFLDTVINKDTFKFSDVEVKSNGFKASTESKARSSSDNFFDAIENYIQGHDVTMDLPIADAKVTVSSRSLDNDELSLNVKFANNDVVEGKGKKGNIFKKGKKHRLRKMITPIMVLILLKAMTVIPMAIGILKIKAFNALALGFFSFIVSVGLAIFQLCKKLAAEHHSAHITAHGPWDGRSVSSVIEAYQPIEDAQNLAYNAYA